MSLPSRLSVTRLVLLLAAGGLLATLGCSKDPSQPTRPGMRASVPSASRTARDPGVAATIAIQKRHSGALRRLPGVVGTAVSVDEQGVPVIWILTERAGTAGLPASLDGVRAVEHPVGRIVPFAKPSPPPPLYCGTSTATAAQNDESFECPPGTAGTLGCVIKIGSKKYFLSCNHVFAQINQGSFGDVIEAPSRKDVRPQCSDTPDVATLYDFVPIDFAGTNFMDAAIAKPVGGLSYTGAMAGGYAPTSTPIEPAVGTLVKKTGRSTFVTHGTISAISADIVVAGEGFFTNQIIVTGSFSKRGDSGALVVEENANHPVGLLFAGNTTVEGEYATETYLNPIQPILDHWGATVSTSP